MSEHKWTCSSPGCHVLLAEARCMCGAEHDRRGTGESGDSWFARHLASLDADETIAHLRAELAATRIRLADRERELAAARLAVAACRDVRRERAANDQVETDGGSTCTR